MAIGIILGLLIFFIKITIELKQYNALKKKNTSFLKSCDFLKEHIDKY